MIAAIYSGLDVLLPFSWLDHNFMKNALLAVLLVTPLFGLLSTMVVSSRMAFFSDSLGHGAFTGIALGAILGLSSPLFSLAAFSVIFALFITYIKNRSNASTDTVIGVFSSTAIAAGLMIMSQGGGFNKFSAYLIGDILSVAPENLAALAMVFLVVAAAWAALAFCQSSLCEKPRGAGAFCGKRFRCAPGGGGSGEYPMGWTAHHQFFARSARGDGAQRSGECKAVSRGIRRHGAFLRCDGAGAGLLF